MTQVKIDQSASGGSPSRRSFLAAAVGSAVALGIPGTVTADANRKRVLRIAHLTDCHIQPERRAGDGVAACLRHVNGLKDKPDLILTGGDHVMDAFAEKRDRTATQWELWRKVLANENGIPIKSCIGNHDIWGWSQKKSESTGKEPHYGKKWAVEVLGLKNRYYSFSQAGWRLIALDSVQPGAKENSYSAYLDDEQLAWLKKELAAVAATTPVLIWSHVPIVSAIPMMLKRKQPTDELTVTPGMCHTDACDLIELLVQYPNVKGCLSGHLHLVDHVQVKGIDFHCNGAVSGNWWRGKSAPVASDWWQGQQVGFEEGYAIVDLYNDGTFKNEYVSFGWTAKPEENQEK